jgi:osmoprotectant transport system ATP-binding protein
MKFQGNTLMIHLHHVSKTFGNMTALHPTDLAVEEGQTLALIGPSGCGKSTLLRLIIGLLQPTTGEVWLNNLQILPDNLLQLRRKMGYVIQEGGLFPHLHAADNATLMARHTGMEKTQVWERLNHLCQLTRFPAEALSQYPVQLSGGQRQRVSLMRALMLDPEVLLLDEPLGALDPMVRSGLQADLKVIFRELGKTVVLVTHDMGEAGYLGDAIVLMREGRIVQQGMLSDLRDRPADPFVSEFLRAQRSLVQL